MRAHQANYAVATQCRVLEVSTSGYYAWLDCKPAERAREDAALSTRIRELHRHSDGTYGSTRLFDDLAEEGLAVSRKRVARLMKAQGLQGVIRRRFVPTTTRNSKASAAPDLVRREFSADGPNKLWVADITSVPTWCDFLYLAVVLDVRYLRCQPISDSYRTSKICQIGPLPCVLCLQARTAACLPSWRSPLAHSMVPGEAPISQPNIGWHLFWQGRSSHWFHD